MAKDKDQPLGGYTPVGLIVYEAMAKFTDPNYVGEPTDKASITMAFKKDDLEVEAFIAEYRALFAQEAKAKCEGAKLGENSGGYVTDGDDNAHKYPTNAGHWILKFTSKSPPVVCGRELQELSLGDLRSGAMVRTRYILNGMPARTDKKTGKPYKASMSLSGTGYQVFKVAPPYEGGKRDAQSTFGGAPKANYADYETDF